jgi:hypothetical protein
MKECQESLLLLLSHTTKSFRFGVHVVSSIEGPSCRHRPIIATTIAMRNHNFFMRSVIEGVRRHCLVRGFG